ncbi:sensor histidine kinase [Enterococcus faecalis]|uniref:sensor histidine kinase n=1 Tax=Enterococcus faecalis TaxID=1351 RepID=UPI001F5A9C2F|nr:GHKL domain-containing protein [Enterococcus faecalis]
MSFTRTIEYYFAIFQYILIFFSFNYLKTVVRWKQYYIYNIFGAIFSALLYIKLDVIATGIVWLFGVLFINYFVKKMNVAILIGSNAILLYVFADYLLGLIVYFFTASFKISPFFMVSVGAVMYICLLFILKFLINYMQEKIKFNNNLIWCLSILSMFTFFSYFVMIIFERFPIKTFSENNINHYFIVIYGLILLVVTMVLLYSFQKEYEMKEKQKEFYYLNIYLNKLEENYNDMRDFRHDYKNILLTIEIYLKNLDIENLKTYFYQEIMPTSYAMDKNVYNLSSLSNLKIIPLKSLITSKLMLAQHLNIKINVEINQEIDELNVDIISLLRAIGIILDNAVEASGTIKNGVIYFLIVSDEKEIEFTTINSCTKTLPPLYQLKKQGFSTKGDRRGLGLKNLDQIVKKNKEFSLDTQINAGEFTQTLLIRNVDKFSIW